MNAASVTAVEKSSLYVSEPGSGIPEGATLAQDLSLLEPPCTFPRIPYDSSPPRNPPIDSEVTEKGNPTERKGQEERGEEAECGECANSLALVPSRRTFLIAVHIRRSFHPSWCDGFLRGNNSISSTTAAVLDLACSNRVGSVN